LAPRSLRERPSRRGASHIAHTRRFQAEGYSLFIFAHFVHDRHHILSPAARTVALFLGQETSSATQLKLRMVQRHILKVVWLFPLDASWWALFVQPFIALNQWRGD
jgi:hypothetical protein